MRTFKENYNVKITKKKIYIYIKRNKPIFHIFILKKKKKYLNYFNSILLF
jgi:hypothetical protein